MSLSCVLSGSGFHHGYLLGQSGIPVIGLLNQFGGSSGLLIKSQSKYFLFVLHADVDGNEAKRVFELGTDLK